MTQSKSFRTDRVGAPLELRLLGVCGLWIRGLQARLGTRKALALLAYLALQPQGATRSELCTLLWPNSDEAQARRSLRVELTRIYALLGEGVVLGESDLLRLRVEALYCDLWELETRLLTLLGPGGVGKTHLAVQAAHELWPQFPDWVFWVSLAALTDSGLLFEAIAGVLGVEAGGLEAHLEGKRMLLVLDNFEQLLGAAPAVARLLEARRATPGHRAGGGPPFLHRHAPAETFY